MSPRTLGLSDALHAYFLRSLVEEPELLRRLREETQALPNARMQIAPEQGRFMRWLVRLIGARHCIEVGTFTGYSALSVALGLPSDGRIVACDVSEEWTQIARRYFHAAGLSSKLDLRIGPALVTLDGLTRAGQSGFYDFAFIDADKANGLRYYELCFELIRPGGLIAVDNTLWGGRVADEAVDDDDTRTIRALNARVIADQRANACLVPIGDGLILAQKL